HYETKQRRRKLIKAYDDSSALIGLAFLPQGSDLSFAVRSAKNKLLLFQASQIVKKATRTAQGAAILRAKNDYLTAFYHEDDLHFIRDREYYRVRKLPTAGRYIREDTLEERQLTLDESGQ
ncbi:MAG TPA: topoisomerase IV, partial [Clostridia bacterium]|nr:topoisomerase IV [Clostridia bacterium]